MTTNSAAYLTELHHLLNQHFNLVEIEDLCFQLNIDYESVPGNEKPSRIRELLLGLARNGRLPELIALTQKLRPCVEWPPLPDGFELPESLVGETAVLANQHHVYGDIVHGDKVSGDKVAGNVINTDGGAYISGNVNTGGGDFVGRDLTISETDEETIGLEQLENRPYIIKVTDEGSAFDSVYTAGGHFIGRDLIINNLEVKDIEHLRPDPCDPPCTPPYQGLLSYDVDDADRFFGRDVLTSEIVRRLHCTSCLTVMGASGSGKSSIVRAGVVPAMLGRKQLVNRIEPPRENWKEKIITPTSQPLSTITQLIFPNDEVTQNHFQNQLKQTNYALANALNEFISVDENQTLLVIDQFEELFTLCPDETDRQSLINNLLYIARNPELPIKIILVLRADFYHYCLHYKDLAQQMAENQVVVAQMDPEELAEAILRPAAFGTWKLQARLLDQMLDDVGQEPGALPLLSHALLETWYRRRLRVMTFSGYREAGGVKGAIAQTAETTFTNLNGAEQLIAKRLFLRLTEPGQESPDTRRKVSFAELEEETVTQYVWQQLVKARLLTADEDGIEVAHETLIREWPRLREWLDTGREELIIHRRLTNAAQTWQERERDSSYLYTGLRLAETEQWAVSNGDMLNELERNFLETSQGAEKKRQRNQRISIIGTTIGLTILVMLAIIMGIINNARNNAEFARETAVAAQATSDINAESANAESTRAVVAQTTAEFNEDQAMIARETSEASAILASTSEAEARAAEAELAVLKNTIQASQVAEAARAELQQDPELALLLAITGLGISNQPDTQARFYDAIFASYHRTFYGHTDVVNLATFSPDGTMIVTASDDGSAKVWDAAGNELASLDGHTARVNYAVFSPDGTMIVTASGDGSAKVWDVSGNELASLNGHSAEVNSAAFSPDGTMIVTASGDYSAKVWNVAGSELATFDKHMGWVNSVVFSPDGKTIVTASSDGSAKVWDVRGNELASLDGHTEWTNSATFSPDGSMIVTASGDGSAKVWDVSGNELASLDGHTDEVKTATFSPDGTMIVTASLDNSAKVWDVSGNELASLDGHIDVVNSAAFSPDGTMIVTTSDDDRADGKHNITTSDDDSAKVWDTAGNELYSLDGHPGGVNSAAFSPDGTMILTAGDDNSIKLWKATGYELATLEETTQEVWSAAFSPDGTMIVTAGYNFRAKVWDTTGHELVSLQHLGPISSATFSPDGKMIVTASNDGAKVWDLSGNELATLDGHSRSVNSAVFSTDGTMIVTASWDNSSKIWDVSGNELASLDGHSGNVNSAVFSTDGTMIVTASDDGSAKVWDAAGNELASLDGHTARVNSAVFSPDGTMIVTASDDGSAKVWNTSGDELTSLDGHTNIVNLAIFSPDGTMIVTASRDYSAKVWDVSGNELASLDGHSGDVNSAAFGSGGMIIVTASSDGSAKVWDVSGNELASLEGHEGRVYFATFSPDETMIVTASGEGNAKVWPFYPTLESKIAVARQLLLRGFTEEECTRFFRDDFASCPRTVGAVFALFDDVLAAP